MSSKGINIVESIRQKLRKKAVETGEIVDFVTARFAYERLLYRLSKSEEANHLSLRARCSFTSGTKNYTAQLATWTFLGLVQRIPRQ